MTRKTTIQTSSTAIMSKKPTYSKGSLEEYLNRCPGKCDRYDFEIPAEAYEFGNKLRQSAMDEENVARADQMKKFIIDISYQTVRIKLNTDEVGRSDF
jgi:hypothetical protein